MKFETWTIGKIESSANREVLIERLAELESIAQTIRDERDYIKYYLSYKGWN